MSSSSQVLSCDCEDGALAVPYLIWWRQANTADVDTRHILSHSFPKNYTHHSQITTIYCSDAVTQRPQRQNVLPGPYHVVCSRRQSLHMSKACLYSRRQRIHVEVIRLSAAAMPTAAQLTCRARCGRSSHAHSIKGHVRVHAFISCDLCSRYDRIDIYRHPVMRWLLHGLATTCTSQGRIMND